MLTLRPYQSDAIAAVEKYISTHADNPCVVLPTGAGKSLVIAEMLRRWRSGCQKFRAIVLAHRKELVEQNLKEFLGCAPGEDAGVYSAGLGLHQMDHAITFAGIDSVSKRAGDFPPFDVVVVDEAHRIPPNGEGRYREFIRIAKICNPRLRVIGFTATPYRLGCGPICHPDHILNEICYEANVADLIRDGYLCMLRSKVSSDSAPDISDVKRNGRGDYVLTALSTAVDKVVESAVASALNHIASENRRAIVWFCVDVKHCREVEACLISAGIHDVAVVTAETTADDRSLSAERFRRREIRHLINCNVFTEGFNVKFVDCVVLLRPTMSKGLYAQMVGRGLRVHPDKSDCLVLDYARCIETHGPIDCLDSGDVKLEVCQQCEEVFSRAVRKCPKCGWEIPKVEVERREAEERQRNMNSTVASQAEILQTIPHILPVDDVIVSIHSKPDRPDSLCVTYITGISAYKEWICLDHDGFAGMHARKWWARRFGPVSAAKANVKEAASDLFLQSELKRITKSITVVREGKYDRIVGYELAT